MWVDGSWICNHNSDWKDCFQCPFDDCIAGDSYRKDEPTIADVLPGRAKPVEYVVGKRVKVTNLVTGEQRWFKNRAECAKEMKLPKYIVYRFVRYSTPYGKYKMELVE